MEQSGSKTKRRRLSDSDIISPKWHTSPGDGFTTPARLTTTNLQTPSRTLTPYSRRAMDIINTPRRPLPLSSHQRQRNQPRFSFRNQLKALGRALFFDHQNQQDQVPQHTPPLASPTTRRAVSEAPSSHPLTPEVPREKDTRMSFLVPSEPDRVAVETDNRISSPHPRQPSLAMSYLDSSPPPEPDQHPSGLVQSDHHQLPSEGFHIEVDDEFYNESDWENLPVIDNDYQEEVHKEPIQHPVKVRPPRKSTASSSLANSTIKHLVNKFSHHLSNQTIDAIAHVSQEYFDQMSQDLADYATHAGRKTISLDDAILLFKRQGKINRKNSNLYDLAHRYLPLELMEEIPLQHTHKKRKKKI